MEAFHPHNDEMTFNTEEANNIVKDCIEGVLGKADYNHDKVNHWTAAIVEQSLTHLVKLGKTYKYIGPEWEMKTTDNFLKIPLWT
ncbi:UNVERIFIED_CONTAM: Dynein light chain Tctex-type 3 [Gekko kuhli]